jgi:hypothetical protein
MDQLLDSIYAAFGVFGFIIIGMGWVIKYFYEENKELKKKDLDNNDFIKNTLIDQGAEYKMFSNFIKEQMTWKK